MRCPFAFLIIGLAGAGLSSPREVAAQDGLAVDRFHPAPPGDRFFGVESAYAAGDAGLHLSLGADHASNPLAIRKQLGSERTFTIVSNQLFLRLGVGLALWDRLLVHASLPLAAFQDGESPNEAGTVYASPDGAQLGDVRLGARVRLAGDEHDPFQLALSGQVWLPSGERGAYVSDGTLRGMPKLVLAGDIEDRLVWSFGFGAELRSSQELAGFAQGSMIRWDGGVGVLLGDEKQVQLGPEFHAAITPEEVRKRTNNGEVLLGAKYRFVDAFEAGLAAGPGLTSGYGTPDARIVASLVYSPTTQRPLPDGDADGVSDRQDRCPNAAAPPGGGQPIGCPPPPPDRDRDGVPDGRDPCPDRSGADHGCPPDADGDGLFDPDDACPTEAAARQANPSKPGCPAPPDRDGDSVPDDQDRCPDSAGVASPSPERHGCPADTDGDTIGDEVDACPAERGEPDSDPTQNGCPTSVRVTGTEIVITEQVLFETGTANISPSSDELLDEVAAVLNDHPEIVKLEVQGHTDDRGAAALNDKLSQERAESVGKALQTRGVRPDRLTAKGYGSSKPIDTNDTPDGRAKNRRVVFAILEKQPVAAPPLTP